MPGPTSLLAKPPILLRQFFGWWTQRLDESIPAVLNMLRAAPRPARIIEISPAGDLTADIAGGTGPAILRLPAEASLIKVQHYPFDILDSIQELLAAEVDRFTPFSADEVAIAHHVTGYDWAAETAEVTFAVLQRDILEDLETRANAEGLEAAAVEILVDERSYLFSLVSDGPRALPSRGIFGISPLFLVATALLMVALFLPINRMNLEVETLRLELEAVRAEADQGAPVFERAQSIERARRALNAEIQASGSMVELFSELSRLLPEDSYLTALDAKNGRLRLTGFSPSSPAVVTALVGSGSLSDIQYRSSVARATNVGMERFEIDANLVRGVPE